ncbi:predicted protein [Lichtheimia corymbifera JMRC:FSU:9682]|uniref:Uncharacterized protein n=1 Tax=Lichtheimia corymbifera JMRC:FSU:9682 TaxID=1263082 RepID=A0A068SDL1_9FUNG|nr:predicted protein [Lichtheimia corymbifera JMRC:FSU:9682]
MAAVASSSTAKFPRSTSSWQRSDKILDVLLPRYYEYDLGEFYDKPADRKSTCFRDDPELSMGDDGDSMYAETLLNSDFMAWLNNEDDDKNRSSSSSSSSSHSWSALERLRMLVAHTATPSFMLPPPPEISQVPTPSFRSSSSVSSSSTTTTTIHPQKQQQYHSTVYPNPTTNADVKGKGKATK